MAQWGVKSWGSWHPGPEAKTICVPCQKWHTTDEAMKLNEKDHEYKQATAWARHKEWVGSERRDSHEEEGTT